MSELEKAARAAAEAADNTEMVRQIAAVLAAQQLLARQQPQAPACQHQQRQGRSAAEWLGIGAAVCVGGVGLAFASIAIAIGALSVAVLALVVRSMWADIQQGKRRR